MRVLRRAGHEVAFPAGQTCCGQPAWNSGFPDEARRVAAATLDAFAATEGPIVGLSGIVHRDGAPRLARALRGRRHAARPGARRRRARARARRVPGRRRAAPPSTRTTRDRWPSTARATSDASSARRAPGRRCSTRCPRSSPCRCPQDELCCGFGGTFSVKFPQVSGAMGLDKARSVVESGASELVSGDLGCLLHVQGCAGSGGHRADDDDARRVPRPRGVPGMSAVFEGDAGLDARLDEALARPQLGNDARDGAADRARRQPRGARPLPRLGRARRARAAHPHGRDRAHGRAARAASRAGCARTAAA